VFARAQGAPDIFMNILTTNGYVARYVTDWAGPQGMLRNIRIRLGAPAVPGRPLRFSGRVTSRSEAGGECELELAVRLANDLGDHATGTETLTLPRERRAVARARPAGLARLRCPRGGATARSCRPRVRRLRGRLPQRVALGRRRLEVPTPISV
jgi:hypothetical protein